MNTNSLEAYQKLDLTKAQMRVYEAIKILGEATMNRVADLLEVPKNTISGRFGEMVKAGVLEIKGKTVEYGSTVGVYKVKKSEPDWEAMRKATIMERQREQKERENYQFDEGLF